MSTITRRSVERWQLANGKLSLKEYQARRGPNTMPPKRVWNFPPIRPTAIMPASASWSDAAGALAALAVRAFMRRKAA